MDAYPRQRTPPEGNRDGLGGLGPILDIRLFGSPRITYRDAPAPFRAPARALLLLAYLAVSRGAVPRKRVAFTLWPDDDEEAALANLRRHLSLLESALPPSREPWLRKDRTTVEWLVDARSHVDSVRFEALASDTERHGEAVELYAGDFLEGTDDEWIIAHRERLRERQLAMLRSLAQRRRAAGDLVAAAEYAQRAYRIDPWREDLLREVMTLRSVAGDASGALSEYRAFVKRVKDELGVEPMSETVETYEAIVKPSRPSIAVAAYEGAPDQRLRSNLPRQTTSLIGRESVVAEVVDLLDVSALVTLVGSGGIGKTRVALRVAEEVLERYRDGVFFVELAALADGGLVAGAVASALGLTEDPSRLTPDALLKYLRPRRLMLVLDNSEHVIEEVAEVASALLHACPDVQILATSREPLNIPGEHAYRVPSLAAPPQRAVLMVADALQYPAVALFAERASAADARFRLTQQNTSAVADVCRRLDGIPLALEMAAGRVRALSPSQLAELLDRHFDVLTGGNRVALPRQQTMRALIDWSHDLLSEREKLLFRRLAIFAGTFSFEAAREVCGGAEFGASDVLDLLSALINKSLVTVESGGESSRYRLLDSVRQYGRERLAHSGELPDVSRRQALWALAFAQEADADYFAVPTLVWNARVEPEMDELRSALVWALGERNDAMLGVRLAAAMRWAWVLFAPHEGRRWVQNALASVDGDTPAEVAAPLWLAETHLAHSFEAFRDTVSASEHARAAFRALGERRGDADAQRFAAHSRAMLGEVAEGEAMLEQALATLRELGEVRLVGRCLNYQALLRSALGDLAGARTLYRSTLAIAQAHGDEHMEFLAAGNLAEVEFHSGDVESALRLNESVLAAKRARKETLGVAVDLFNRATYLVALGRYQDARATLLEALEVARGQHAGVHVEWGLQRMATVAAALGDDERAARLIGHVDAAFRAAEVGRDPSQQREHERVLASLSERLGNGRFDALLRAGSQLTEDEAVAEALRL
jgi:predicted ATPase/DNA-binding SARP family transcriptional activator